MNHHHHDIYNCSTNFQLPKHILFMKNNYRLKINRTWTSIFVYFFLDWICFPPYWYNHLPSNIIIYIYSYVIYMVNIKITQLFTKLFIIKILSSQLNSTLLMYVYTEDKQTKYVYCLRNMFHLGTTSSYQYYVIMKIQTNI